MPAFEAVPHTISPGARPGDGEWAVIAAAYNRVVLG